MRRWSKEKALKAVGEFIEKHNRFPTAKEMDSFNELPARNTFKNHVGISYSEWRKKNDTTHTFVNKKFYTMSENELKQWLTKRLKDMETTNIYEYDKLRDKNEPSSTFWKSRYKWSNLMVELGLREIRHYTKSDTIAKFKMIYEKLGTTPSITQLRSADTQLVYSIMLHFNRYNNFLDYLNIEYVLDYEHVEKTDEELINDYLDLCNHLGKLATLREVSSCEWTVSSEKYLERFGSIHRVREMAGLDVGKLGKPFYSREMLDRKITSVIKEYGRDISVKEFLFRLGCAKATLARYYGTTSIREVISIVSGKENEK